MIDQSTYGFSKQDAESLLGKIELKDELTSRKPLPGRRRGGASGSYVEEVRWVDPVLEYRIGATWYTIDTAENCSSGSVSLVSGLGV